MLSPFRMSQSIASPHVPVVFPEVTWVGSRLTPFPIVLMFIARCCSSDGNSVMSCCVWPSESSPPHVTLPSIFQCVIPNKPSISSAWYISGVLLSPSMNQHPCRLSETACSVYSQLLSVHAQLEYKIENLGILASCGCLLNGKISGPIALLQCVCVSINKLRTQGLYAACFLAKVKWRKVEFSDCEPYKQSCVWRHWELLVSDDASCCK